MIELSTPGVDWKLLNALYHTQLLNLNSSVMNVHKGPRSKNYSLHDYYEQSTPRL